MLTIKQKQLGKGVYQYLLYKRTAPMSFAEGLQLWRLDQSFRTIFIEALIASPFSAYCWEMPPITSESVNRPFEFVLIDAPGLIRRSDPAAFSGCFGQDDAETVVVFENLGKDALLVVPRAQRYDGDYCHLAGFIRSAPDEQKHVLWQKVGRAVEQRLNERPLWLSTAGGGVPWLHVRLDSRPKYYRYGAYRNEE